LLASVIADTKPPAVAATTTNVAQYGKHTICFPHKDTSREEAEKLEANTAHKPTMCRLFCINYVLDEMWKVGHVAKSHCKLGQGCVDFKFLFPVLKCFFCSLAVQEMTVPVGDAVFVFLWKQMLPHSDGMTATLSPHLKFLWRIVHTTTQTAIIWLFLVSADSI
jgi:hypothetical protein